MEINNLNLSNFPMASVDPCLTATGGYNGACLYRALCPQIPAYLVTYGLAILLGHVLVTAIFFFLRRLKPYIRPIGDIDIPLGIFKLYFPLDFSQDKTIDWWLAYMNEMIITASSIYIFVVLFWALGR